MRYEDATDTAKKIRKALKVNFPGVKFKVKTEKYSMGSAVDVYWTDGPSQTRVNAVVHPFQSVTFDGLDDSTTHHGYIDADGKRTYGAHYISTQHHWSPARATELLALGHTLPLEGYQTDRSRCIAAELHQEAQ